MLPGDEAEAAGDQHQFLLFETATVGAVLNLGLLALVSVTD